MAIKQRAGGVPIFPGYVSSGAQSSNFTSIPLDILEYSNYSIQLIMTSQSSLNVAVTVQESNDGNNWDDVPASTVSFTANGSYIWRMTGSGSCYTRLSFAFTAGSALFYGLIMAKL